MSFEKGAKVQAVDELGRWEEARIIEKDGLNYEVNFVGWGSRFNRVLNSDDVRDIVDPFKTAVQTGKWETLNF